MIGLLNYMHAKKGVLKGWHKGTHAHHNTNGGYFYKTNIYKLDLELKSLATPIKSRQRLNML